MATHFLISTLLLFSSLVGPVLGGGVLFSTLPQTLSVEASPIPGEVLKAGKDKITVRWGLNQCFQGTINDDEYKVIRVYLCFAPISQIDRPWRRTKDDLTKDKTCTPAIISRNYSKYHKEETFEWTIRDNISTATYFIRAYAVNSEGKEVAFGQTTNEHKTINLFEIEAMSVPLRSNSILAACMSVFCVISVCWFCVLERRRLRSERLQDIIERLRRQRLENVEPVEWFSRERLLQIAERWRAEYSNRAENSNSNSSTPSTSTT